MTKQYFIELADYNVWANNIVCSWLEQISDEQWNKEVVSSFPSVRETVLHIISAETAWFQRLTKVENVQWLANTYTGSKAEYIVLLKRATNVLKVFVKGLNETALEEVVSFKRLNGELNSMPLYQALAHTFNHSTFHRGQLVTMLRQVDFTKVGSTDLLGYYRIKNAQ